MGINFPRKRLCKNQLLPALDTAPAGSKSGGVFLKESPQTKCRSLMIQLILKRFHEAIGNINDYVLAFRGDLTKNSAPEQ